jgi:hypothetical protein
MKKRSLSDLFEPNPTPARVAVAGDSMTAIQHAVKKRPTKTADLVLVSIRCTDKERKKMRLTAIELGVSVQALVLEAIEEYRKARGLR